jgi:hypothetical protein
MVEAAGVELLSRIENKQLIEFYGCQKLEKRSF